MRASRMSENKSGMERPRVPTEQGANARIDYRVRVMGVDTIWRSVVQHTALRRQRKQRRKPVFGLLVTNRFTIREQPTREVCAECHTEHHQQRMLRMPTHTHSQAREAARSGRLRMRGMRKVGQGSKVVTRAACGALTRSCHL